MNFNDCLFAVMNFPKQVEECGEKIDQRAQLQSYHYLGSGKVHTTFLSSVDYLLLLSLSIYMDPVVSLINVLGTDLNRNFPCSWGAGVGSTTWLQGSSLPFWETYIGR